MIIINIYIKNKLNFIKNNVKYKRDKKCKKLPW